MQDRVCLDTGVIMLHFSKTPPPAVEGLMSKAKNGTCWMGIPAPVFIEVFKYMCAKGGKDYARSSIQTFRAEIPTESLAITDSIIDFAGALKCQYRNDLSYIGCIAIATSVENYAILHTTEEFPKIPKFRMKKYSFS